MADARKPAGTVEPFWRRKKLHEMRLGSNIEALGR